MTIYDFQPADLCASSAVSVPVSVPVNVPAHFTNAVALVDAWLIAGLLAQRTSAIMVVCDDDRAQARLHDQLCSFALGCEIITLPAWDCLPYDRASPHPEILGQRTQAMIALNQLAADKAAIILTTINATIQKMPPQNGEVGALFLKPDASINRDGLLAQIHQMGYTRVETVREPGEYSLRGSIIDIFVANNDDPVRLDFFGDEIESLRSFDPYTQISKGKINQLNIQPVHEIQINAEACAQFRSRYRRLFGTKSENDPLYQAITENRYFPGYEHWLPLFYDKAISPFAYLPDDCLIVLGQDTRTLLGQRCEMIEDHYNARLSALDVANANSSTQMAETDDIYRPIPPDLLYLDEATWQDELQCYASTTLHIDRDIAGVDQGEVRSLPINNIVPFHAERLQQGTSLHDALVTRLQDDLADHRVLICCATQGSIARITTMLDQDYEDAPPIAYSIIDTIASHARVRKSSVGICLTPLDEGFCVHDLIVYADQDIFGTPNQQNTRRTKRQEEAILHDISQIVSGDYCIHQEYGIGRYHGLKTLSINNNAHDCLELEYADDNKLFLPVENIDMLSRYGAAGSAAMLDKLGAGNWQARLASVSEKLKLLAETLLQTAAKRKLSNTDPCELSTSDYRDFLNRFLFAETNDQTHAAQDIESDLTSGQLMDRLICGDVGFGKTEIALRAAFIVASNQKQVALVVPTTLLARQHMETFQNRFHGLPIRIAMLSRLSKQPANIKREVANGEIDIIIGTHALLAKSISFKNLGLVIIDEEQHFGVAQKERLKEIKDNIHILTLTATPIPRTLQMAMSGVRDLSLIASPPLDRLAVRTFVMPFDRIVIGEAIMRELLRSGQLFFVCPHISDMSQFIKKIHEIAPKLRIAQAHGQMPAQTLDTVMNDFANHRYDALLSTNIIESGLDLPNVNTIIIHRADRMGLAQLYQLRGRVGRAKARGYCYFTLPPKSVISQTAMQRLQIIRRMEGLGAGFSLASHDMDIRGAGNLIGSEQSGHIREIGAELYQRMLSEAITNLQNEKVAEPSIQWSPRINIEIPVFINKDYMPDLGLRMGIYRRASNCKTQDELDQFHAELIDRFGPIPPEVHNLLKIIGIKILCYIANVSKIDAGPKGGILTFHKNYFANVDGLLALIRKQSPALRMRPNNTIAIIQNWQNPAHRLKSVHAIIRMLAVLSETP